jgi:hypothetical protein
MNKPYDHSAPPPENCSSWVPDHIRQDTPTLDEYMRRVERQKAERDDEGFSLIEKAMFFGGSILATTAAIGALAIAQVDKAFHLGVGEKLAHITPDAHDDGLKHDAQQILHDFGQKIVEDEK